MPESQPQWNMEELERTARKTIKASLPGLLAFVLLIGGIVAVFRYFDAETLQTYIAQAGIWAPLVLIAAKATTIVVAPLGGSPLYPLAGALFGFWNGFFYLMLGDAIGGIISFYLSRIYGRRVVNYFFPDNQLIDKVLHVLGSIKGLLIARVGFITFPELISYAAGLTRISFVPFFLIFISIGAIPTAVLVGLGTFLVDSSASWVFIVITIAGALLCMGSLLLFAQYVRTLSPDLQIKKDIKDDTMGF